MSRYDWERGTLKFTAAAFPKFRKELADKYNDYQARCFAVAQAMHEALVAAKKASPRGKFNAGAWLDTDEGRRFLQFLDRRVSSQDHHDSVLLSVVGRTPDNWPDYTKLRRPLKKDFPLALASKTTAYRWGYESGVTLNLAERTLTWDVSESNHAVERAHEHPMAQWLFRALSQVDWGRSGGGVIVGNDEYNQDDSHAGGGANYITYSFGPAGRKLSGVETGRIVRSIASRLARY